MQDIRVRRDHLTSEPIGIGNRPLSNIRSTHAPKVNDVTHDSMDNSQTRRPDSPQTNVPNEVSDTQITIAAAAFGAILYTVITGDSIVSALTNIINRALNTNV
jgi:hypothetical protein